jgi:FHA domain
MTAALGRWRATYTPGEWVVLSGPSSLVLLEPPTHEWASLVSTLWDEVVASSSITDLAARLAHFKIAELPSLAAFFWTEDGMRSLIRGEISVVDLATGKEVANGDGIQTWSEVGLAGVDHIRVDLPHEGDATLLELPLVVGAVRASSVTLDASQQAQVSSPQAEPESATDMPEPATDMLEAEAEADAASAAPVERTAPLSTAEIAAIANAETELMPPPFEGSESGAELAADTPQDLEAAVVPQLARDPAVVAAQAAASSSDDSAPDRDLGTDFDMGDSAILAVLCPNGHTSPPSATSCRVCGGPVAAQGPQFVAYPILAVVRASDGTSAELDRPILIGRAPSTDRTNSRAPRLMTVPSPNNDISRAHLEVAPDGWQIVVTDLNSTNGTILVRPGGGDRQQLAPGEPVPVQVGSVIELGDGVSVLIDFPQ